VSDYLSFGHWSPRPHESVHRSVTFLAFNVRHLAFIAHSSARIRVRRTANAGAMLRRNNGAKTYAQSFPDDLIARARSRKHGSGRILAGLGEI